MSELRLQEQWLNEYIAKRHQPYRLQNGAENTPEGRRYCRNSMFSLIRRTIAKIRELRRL